MKEPRLAVLCPSRSIEVAKSAVEPNAPWPLAMIKMPVRTRAAIGHSITRLSGMENPIILPSEIKRIAS